MTELHRRMELQRENFELLDGLRDDRYQILADAVAELTHHDRIAMASWNRLSGAVEELSGQIRELNLRLSKLEK